MGRWSPYGSICQQCTVVPRLSLSLSSRHRHLIPPFSLSVAIFPSPRPTYPPHLNSLSSPPSLSFCSSSLSLSLSLSIHISNPALSVSVNQSPPSPAFPPPPFTYLSLVPASFPTFPSHGHLPFGKSIFPHSKSLSSSLLAILHLSLLLLR